MNGIFSGIYATVSSFWPPSPAAEREDPPSPLSEAEETSSMPEAAGVLRESAPETPSGYPFAPPTLVPLMMLDLAEKAYGIASDLLRSSSRELEVFSQSLRKKGVEITAALQQAAIKTQEAGVWSMLQKIGSCVLATLNVAAGFSLQGSDREKLGTVLIASGILSLVNLAVSEMRVWPDIARRLAGDNKDLEKVLKFWTPLFASCLPLAVNGAAMLYDPSVFSESTTFAWKGAVDLYGNVTTGGKHFAEGSLQRIEANISLLRSVMFIDSFDLDSLFSKIPEGLEEANRPFEQVKGVIQMQNQLRV